MALPKNHICGLRFKRWIVGITCMVSLPFLSAGQVIYSNMFTGSGCPGPESTPTVSGNATGTAFSRGGTVACQATADVFNSKNLNTTASVNDASYIEFSVTANADAKLTVTSLSFSRQASNTAPNQLEVRYSTTNFATSTSWGAAPPTTTSKVSTTWDFTDFSVPSGTTLTFRFYPYGTQSADGTGSSGSAGTFRLDDIMLNGSAPLPVSLVSFTGKSTKNGVTLNWVTAWEEQNKGFEVQKSTNAKSFEGTGAVDGKYTTTVQSVYEFTDPDVQPGQVYYYRLKQKDVGGAVNFSQIIAVLASAGEQAAAAVFPNPNKGNFTLAGQELVPANIRLYAPSGVEIPIGTAETEGRKTLDIWTKTFVAPGVYYLHINPTDGAQTKALKVLVE